VRLTPARWAAGLGVAALPLFFAALRHPGFADNEGRYAEVARELVARGDWITPHLNGAPFLNKPPLLFWLTALVFGAVGPTESARLVSGVATLATMAVLYDLGRRLSGSLAGAWAVAAYLTAMSTTVEARTLRPDAWLTLTVAVSLWGAVRLGLDLPRLEAARPARRGRAGGFLALWGGAALGVMAKGLLGLVLPALILLPAVLLGGRPAVIRRWRAGAGLVLVAALVLPWHLAAARANPGFAWDYIVNQHLLFFLDRKLPRDSVPDPLWYAWAAFALRLTPWVLLLPAAVLRQLREARRAATAAAWLPLTWLGMVWLLFSLAPSRLEHYFLPAVPAAALLVGPLCADWAGADGRRGGRAALGACLALTALGAAGALLLPGRLAAGALATGARRRGARGDVSRDRGADRPRAGARRSRHLGAAAGRRGGGRAARDERGRLRGGRGVPAVRRAGLLRRPPRAPPGAARVRGARLPPAGRRAPVRAPPDVLGALARGPGPDRAVHRSGARDGPAGGVPGAPLRAGPGSRPAGPDEPPAVSRWVGRSARRAPRYRRGVR
jgi:4-amino-4-deoxy-L-arabinose transferase-like glycosyltransferase